MEHTAARTMATTTTTTTTTASTSPTATPAATPALAPPSPCLVVDRIDVVTLLEAGEAGSEDGELGTEEPVSLLPSPPVVGTIDVAALLEVSGAGSEYGVLGREKPALLPDWEKAVVLVSVSGGPVLEVW